jgi:hypothetical protein
MKVGLKEHAGTGMFSNYTLARMTLLSCHPSHADTFSCLVKLIIIVVVVVEYD